MKVTATHPALAAYHEALRRYAALNVSHEMGLRGAFQGLLDTLAKQAGWTLIPEQTVAGGRARPDATLRDAFNLPRGFWEAKDAGDDLDVEIKKKAARGYPLTNTIFEDTQRAVLYQNKRVADEADARDPNALAGLLTQFFSYEEPDTLAFQAVPEFGKVLPDLAHGLIETIRDERTSGRNAAFQRAFTDFFALCQTTLNPQIRPEAIEEMLAQHLLTERLFRTIFENADFADRNVIAREIEAVIRALTSRAFNRAEFLRKLDRYYVPIERAARGLEDWSEKQGFLNTVYERFFQGFSQKQADTQGIVYTPQEIVDWMCASVDEVLQTEFGLSLGSSGVVILDPCTGTGNFVVNLLRRIPLSRLRDKYARELFANENMLLPYYIASLNIEHEYYARAGEYQSFEGICFVDTLGLSEGDQLAMFAEENTERVERQKDIPVTVIIGNPPYNVGQANENDNNKNRRYPVVDKRIKETYVKDSRATLSTKVYDAYVRFFRWATDRLQGRDGVVCFISNNSFVDQIAFDGMRKHLLDDFTRVYHVDLHGNVRKNPKLSGTTHNVFGIQVGAGITVAVRSAKHAVPQSFYFRVPEEWTRRQKLAFLAEQKSLDAVPWQTLSMDENGTWFTDDKRNDFADLLPLGSKEAKSGRSTTPEVVFRTYSLGVSTNRDAVVYDFNRKRLAARIRQFIGDYNAEVARWVQAGRPKDLDGFLSYEKVKWSEHLKGELRRARSGKFDAAHIRQSLYRPFNRAFLYYDGLLDDRPALFGRIFPSPESEAENIGICVGGPGGSKDFHCLAINAVADLHFTGDSQCFPLYTYDEDGSNRRDNVTDWTLVQFRTKYGDDAITKRDIFHYVYAVLHHPAYRKRYQENLKRELPRIPHVADSATFALLAAAGARLAALHTGYEDAPEYPLRFVEDGDATLADLWHVQKMRLTKDKTALVVNGHLTLDGIPADAFRYRLGNRSALDWVIDQYQVTTDKRSGIVSDPNRPDDPEYIAHLALRVVHVSAETVKIVDALPSLGLPE